MQYCIYLRKSRADADLELRGEGETLARHETALLALAKKLNLNITAIYREILSGETIDARPVMQQLLKEVEQGMWIGVLVMEVERLARGDTRDQGTVAQAFKYSSTKIITPAKTYDPNNEFDEEYFEFGLFMSRREYKTINRRIQRGRLASVKEGKFIASTAPFGYIKTHLKNDKGFTLVPHPEEADIVRLIFDLYTSGQQQEDGSYKRLGMHLIAKRLDTLCICPQNSNKWSRATIKGILTNYTYIGKITWQKAKESKQIVDGKIKKTRVKQKDFLIYDGLHSPIIEEEIFYAAQEILTGKKIAPIASSKALKNPLTGIIFCAICGKPMTRLAPNKRNQYSTLKCPNIYCDNVSSPITLVEEQIIIALKQWLNDYQVECTKKEKKNTITSDLDFKTKSLSRLQTKLGQLKLQQTNLYNLLEQGIYSTELFLERSKSLGDDIDKINSEMDQITKEYNIKKKKQYSQETFIPSVLHVVDIYSTLQDAATKNEVLKSVIKRIEYTKTVRNTKGQINTANFSILIFPNIPD